MKHWSLKTKLIVAMMTTNAIGMLVVAVAFFSNNLALLDSRLESRIATELDLMSQNIGPALLFRDRSSAEEMLHTLSVDPAIVRAHLYHRDSGEPFAVYRRGVGEVDETTAPEYAGLLRQRTDVIVDGEVQGSLEIVATADEIRDQTRQLCIYTVAVLIAATLVVLVTSFKLQKIITAPIIALNRLAREVAKSRDYSLRSRVDKEDEIGELSQEFNRMLAQIENRDVMLEKQVQQRTAELEKLAEEFRHRAFHDPLTGLPNRAYLSEYFLTATAHARRNQEQMLLMLLDLDNFKTINDSLGHNYGDELLKVVADRLKSALRSEDAVVRLGGDEFVVLVENITRQADAHVVAQRVAQQILQEVQGEVDIHGRSIRVTTSIGGSFFPEHGTDLVALKRSADIAMYHSKSQGRNRFSIFTPRMEHSAVQRLIVQNDLDQGLQEDQFRLLYQPKLDAASDTVIGCEALVRWSHPREGLLTPDHFIPFAEENGMIRDIDYYVMDRACEQAFAWYQQEGLELPVSINLSADHFTDRRIVARVREALERTGVPPRLLEVEVTEAMLIHDPELALEVLGAIRELGVSVSLDDFGIGYSSLNYLRTLPVDLIKLDRSFVGNILTDKHGERLTRGIVALANGLELEILAEGVETDQQRDKLLEIGCRLMQGYFFLRPCEPESMLQWLRIRARGGAAAADGPA